MIRRFARERHDDLRFKKLKKRRKKGAEGRHTRVKEAHLSFF